MALQCGTSNDGCQGKAGKYRIEYTLVDPSYVRYRYAGEAWREVKKADSNLTHQSNKISSPGQGQGVRYQLSAWTRVNLWYDQPGTGPDRFDGTFFPHYGLPWEPRQFTGPITNVRFFRADEQAGGRNHIWIAITDATGTRIFTAVRYYREPDAKGTLTSAATSQYWLPAPPPPNYELLGLRFVRVDGQPEPERWRFRVLDALGNVIFAREETTQPEAVIIPEAYGSNTGSFVIGNSRQNVPLRIVNSEANNRKSTSILLGNTVIKKLDSPLGSSLFPRVCWDCTEDEKCPENTCSVDCGDRTCCYNSQGISVKEIRK